MTTFLFYYSLTLTIVVLYQNRDAVRDFVKDLWDYFRGL